MVVWFSGLSGAGKSTLANKLAEKLKQEGKLVYNLDGDQLRQGLNKNLGFSAEDRLENLRRAAEIAKILNDLGYLVLASFITPLQSQREAVKEVLNDELIEIFIDCELAVCEQRDVKGLYAKARNGLIEDFTGISSPFEKNLNAHITINTSTATITQSIDLIYQHLKKELRWNI